MANLRNVVIAGFALALVLFGLYCAVQGFDGATFELFALRWLHIGCGTVWVGLLFYFNFVEEPGRSPALRALFWLRWSAMGTIFLGLVLALRSGYLLDAYTLDLAQGLAGYPVVPKFLAIGIGMWLGTIMWFNVWFLIWPAQQRALDIGGRHADLPAAERAAAARTAASFSRINLLLSIPMLFSMVAAGHLY